MDYRILDFRYLSDEELNPQEPDLFCCMCRAEFAPIPEPKPSGVNLDIQVWYYCQECWDEMCALRRATPIMVKGFLHNVQQGEAT